MAPKVRKAAYLGLDDHSRQDDKTWVWHEAQTIDTIATPVLYGCDPAKCQYIND